MPKDIPELSRTEWLVMKVCWKRGSSTARQVYDEALKQRKWEYQTVKTMLDRLVEKGYLSRDKLGPLCMYKPLASRPRIVGRAIESFVTTVLDDTVAPLFAHFAKGGNLSSEELNALKQLIEAHEKEDADDR